jgi:hypothetical protein
VSSYEKMYSILTEINNKWIKVYFQMPEHETKSFNHWLKFTIEMIGINHLFTQLDNLW